MTDSHDQRSIQQLVLKIHSRCDLACDHCYVYEHADQSWKSRPILISEEALDRVAHRLAEYASVKGLESVAVILHGGEPLLVGPARMRHICAELTRAVAPVTSLDLRIHTNGVQLSRRHMEVFREFGVKVGISLDGDRAANDRHRLDRRGRSSYDRVLRALDLLRLPEYRHLYQGILCTVDVANDPVAVHDALTALDPPRIDYLLPHSTWDNPPPGQAEGPSGTAYADWLLKVFDRWEEQGRPMPVRTFDSVLSTLRGGPSLTEAMGLVPTDLAVVETDGTFEQADSLKTAYEGAPATGYDVLRHSFQEFAEHPGVRARQLGLDGISETCRRCPVVRSCGGGLYAHRYSAERGFDNPSVYCADLRAFVEGVAGRITEHTLAPAVTGRDELRPAHLALDRTLLARVHRNLAGHPDGDAAWRLLDRLDSDERTAAHLHTVLAHPYARPALHRSLDGPVDVPRFMAVATAAAVLAETETTLAWHQPGTEVYLPTLGTVRLAGPGRVEFTVTAEGFGVRGVASEESGGAEVPVRWRPLEVLDLPSMPPRPTAPTPEATPNTSGAPPHPTGAPPHPLSDPADAPPQRVGGTLDAPRPLLGTPPPPTGDPTDAAPPPTGDPTDAAPSLTGDTIDRPPLLIDDADPYRDCYPVPVAAPLSASDLALFGKRLRAAYDMLDSREPGWRESVNALLATTVTPLAAGSGLRLGSHGPGALGVAVDFEPEEFVRQLPLLGRRARLIALREVADLHVPGHSAGALLDEASRRLGRAAAHPAPEALAEARRALDRLGALAPGELTESGAHLAAELTQEWAALHD